MDFKSLDELDREVGKNAYPYFSNPSFGSQLEKGWLNNYEDHAKYSAIAFIIYILASLSTSSNYFGNEPLVEQIPDVDSNGVPTGTFTNKYYDTTYYGTTILAFAIFSLLPLFGMFFQERAICSRSLKKQDWSLKFFNLYVTLQFATVCLNRMLVPFSYTYGMLSTSIFGIVFLVLGILLKMQAFKMREAMVQTPENKKVPNYQLVFHQPRYFS